jgi:hypothetical protein
MALFCCLSLSMIVGLNAANSMDGSLFGNGVYCLVDVFATGRSSVQSSPTECGVSECDLETSPTRKPRPTTAVES